MAKRGTYRKKSTAQKKAKAIRKRGNVQATVSKTKKGYAVYTSRKKK